MAILLAGDIGGTKTILRLVKAEKTETTHKFPTLITLYEQTYSSKEFPDLVPIVCRLLEAATEQLGERPIVEKACFGIAGPVTNNTAKLTNLSWSLEGDRIERELSIAKVSLINDFAAIGYGVLGLSEQDLYALQAVESDRNAPIAILGAGTGLGEGFLIPLSDGSYRVFSSEGGHVDFAPHSTLEFQLLNYILEKNNLERVSVERIVSGQGIISIYQFLWDRDSSQSSPAFAKIYQTWLQELGKEEKTVDLAAEISKAAIAQSDRLCQQTMRLFVEAYGAEAGNLALKLLPYGGLYIAGGISAKILSLLQQEDFMKAFKAKGRVSPILNKIPVYVVLNPKVGLIGAAFRAAQI
ncbi:glucokinase [Hydrococcus rivularis NIES-593]|uniref:Glucokinase n=1 Tax=Hydrococcus rivularis NIES-593 TaxID=1921803 RepID=A0A1U7HHD3_9CYAN|nr:glucokinase [Hydrococcus rivularis]OKH22977.1 glucokinase [Hydrococcus rivularis NIES-593]